MSALAAQMELFGGPWAIPVHPHEELAQRILDAADWGHCLECGCKVDAFAGAVLCEPCDAEAMETEADCAAMWAGISTRVMAELEAPRPVLIAPAYWGGSSC